MGLWSNVTSIASDVKDKVSSTVSNATDNISNWLNSTYNNTTTAEKITTPSIYLTGNNNVATTNYNGIPNTTSKSSDATSNNTTKSGTYTATTPSINGVTISKTPTQYENLADYETDKAKTTAIENIQKSLNTLGYTYGDEGQLKIDGDFGIKTQTNWDNFISDLGVDNYLSGIASNVKNIYNNITQKTSTANYKSNLHKVTSSAVSNKVNKKSQSILNNFGSQDNENTTVALAMSSIKDVLDDTEIPEGYIQGTQGIEPDYRPYDSFKSWQDALNSWNPFKSFSEQPELQEKVNQAQGVVAFEIGLSGGTSMVTGGCSYGVAIDPQGNYAIYKSSNAGTNAISTLSKMAIGFPLGFSLGATYYNMPDASYIDGESVTTGGMLVIAGLYSTQSEQDGVSYSGLSLPIGLGAGISHVKNNSEIIKEGNLFNE